MRLRTNLSIRAALIAGLVASAASAQTEGFSLNRFEPSERGSEWFALESLQFDGDPRWTFGLVGDWAYKPLVLYQDGEEQAALVEHQLFAHLGASVILKDFVRLGVSLPLGLVDGDDVTVNGTPFGVDSGAALGDLRLGADVRFFGKNRGPVRAGAGLQLHLPTGSRDAFTGDGSPRFVPRVMLAGDAGQLAWSGQLAVNIRTQGDDFAGEPFGSEVNFAAAVGARVLDDKLLVGPEIYGSTGVSDGDAVFARKSTPFELVLGGHYQITEEWRAGAGLGPGISRGFGTPQLRVLASVEWSPAAAKPIAPVDSDGDGIVDDQDACRETPGVATSDPKTNGCPPPKDSDGDGIIDPEDACPNVAGIKTSDPKTNGCPPPSDADKDGIVDAQDACPAEPGPASTDPAKNGCPLPKDSDGDGIIDPEDACPEQKGDKNVDPKKNGCPKAVVIKGEIKILERIEFDTGKATIRPESDGVLQAVLKIMKEHPEINQVRVEGHTDNRGAKGLNLTLSRNRAAAVVQWLVAQGIEKKRLTSQGLGQTKPIDTNDTDAGRQNNRRVEFHIVENKGATKVESK
jgi:OmpA-OmpF porin, OOP family